MGRLLTRGMVSGLIAAVFAFLVAYLVGEGPVGSAIDLESAASAAAGIPAEPDQVSRTVQSTLGLAVAVAIYGAAIGGLFAIAYAFALGRLGRLSERATALVVAAGGFLTVFLLPFLKYPANPPAVGSAETIGRRTGLYLLMMLISVLAGIGAAILARQLEPRLGSWNGTIAAIVIAGLVVLGAAWVMPNINEVGREFPAATLWSFRMASIEIQFVLWSVLGIAFSALTARAAAPRRVRAARRPAEPEPAAG
ncbi:CbtA family protein [Cryptosporangium aurantiacum]|uniref:CbtA family protein n=1 Tax=Cryptosporangium aurantiacum TaxID=134849 RepID=UPI000932D92D|nr:CbtA family protein [Cryptosporangium aurantiacum]